MAGLNFKFQWIEHRTPQGGIELSVSVDRTSGNRTYTDQQGRFEMLPPAGLEVQIFVNPKETQNVPAEPAGLSINLSPLTCFNPKLVRLKVRTSVR